MTRARLQTAFAISLALYLLGYGWIRSTSVRIGGGDIIVFGITDSEYTKLRIARTPSSEDHRTRRKMNALGAIFFPVIWIETRVAGTRFASHAGFSLFY